MQATGSRSLEWESDGCTQVSCPDLLQRAVALGGATQCKPSGEGEHGLVDTTDSRYVGELSTRGRNGRW